MANPFLPSKGGNPFLPSGTATKSAPHRSILGSALHGVAQGAGNLASDVKDAVVGIPAGTVALIRHPERTAKVMAQTTWQTWSPLFHGHIGEFAQQTYDHPLAPLLDVATVFTLGAGSVARGASILERAGVESSTISKVAKLREPRTITLEDPTGQGRKALPRDLSTRAGRRVVQETVLSLEPHLPQWFTSATKTARYNSRFQIDMARRQAAKSLMLTTAIKAGRVLSDSHPGAPRVREELAGGMYLNLLRHNDALPAAEAEKLVKGNGHYRYVRAYETLDPATDRHIKKLTRREGALQTEITDHAPIAAQKGALAKELGDRQKDLADLYSQTPAVIAQAKTLATKKAQRAAERAHQAALRDADREVRRLQKEHDAAVSSEARVTNATSKLQATTALRQDAERRSFADYFRPAGESAAAFESWATNFGRRSTTPVIERAARDSKGNVYVVPLHDAKNLGHEAANSSKLVRYLWDKPTSLWKTAMLGWTPRTFTNNGVGNALLYMVREGDGIEGIKAVGDAMRYAHGDDVAERAKSAALTVGPRSAVAPFRRDNWLYRHFGDEIGNVFGREILDESVTTKSRLARSAKAGIYPLVHKIADEPVRIAAIGKYLRRDPAIRDAMRGGLTFDRAAQKALKKDPDLRRRAADYARVVAGDYETVRPWEKTVRDLVPFYLWDRHILRSTGNAVLDTPGRVALLQAVSNDGIAETESVLGDIPEFLKGALPLQLLGLEGAGGARKSVLLTASLNPWATVGEIAGAAQALTVGGGVRNSEVLSSANPILTGTIEFATGRNLLTGAPKAAHGGLVPSLVENLTATMPGVKLLEAATSKDASTSAAGNPYLYSRDDRSAVSSFLGFPLRNVSPEAAKKQKEKEDNPTPRF